MLQYIKIGQNPSFGSRGKCFWSKFDTQIADVTVKMRSRPPNLITSFPRPNNVSVPVWSNSTNWFRRKSADKKLCRRRQDPHQKHYAPPPRSPPPTFLYSYIIQKQCLSVYLVPTFNLSSYVDHRMRYS